MEKELNYMHAEITGGISVKMANDQTLDDFCAEYIAEYNRDRFEALAIRVFVGSENVITVYAIDKTRQDNTTINKGKIPVKKFKLTNVDLSAIFSYCQSFNCTLSTGNFPIEDMEVTNK